MSKRTKVLTNQCPSCEYCIIDEANGFMCLWGKSKEPKLLVRGKGKTKVCKLIFDKKLRKKYALYQTT